MLRGRYGYGWMVAAWFAMAAAAIVLALLLGPTLARLWIG